MLEEDNIDSVSKEILNTLDKAVKPSWEKEGLSTEDFALNLLDKLQNLKGLMKSGQGDQRLVKSTLTDSLEFLSWVSVAKEIANAKTMIQTQLVRERDYGRSKRTIKAK